jgi:hypothetical protein
MHTDRYYELLIELEIALENGDNDRAEEIEMEIEEETER